MENFLFNVADYATAVVIKQDKNLSSVIKVCTWEPTWNFTDTFIGFLLDDTYQEKWQSSHHTKDLADLQQHRVMKNEPIEHKVIYMPTSEIIGPKPHQIW